MNLKEELNKIVDEVSGIVTPTIEENIKEKDYNVDSLLEGLELDSSDKKEVNKEEEQFKAKVKLVKESLKPKFLGKFNSKNIPNPVEFPEGTTYRNINEGVVYSRNEQGLWEEFVRDGIPGKTPKSWPTGGGIGVQEATNLINNQIILNNKQLTKDGWFVVATNDSSDIDKQNANLVLSGNNVALDFQNAFTKEHSKIMLLGNTLQLNDDVVVSGIDNITLYSPTKCQIITKDVDIPPSYTNPSYSVLFKGQETQVIGKTQTSGTILKGTTNLPHYNPSLITVLFPGDYIHIQSDQSHNANRPLQEARGEINRIKSISTSAITLERCLRDDYDAYRIAVYKIDYIKNITIENVSFNTHQGTINRPALMSIQNGKDVNIINCSAIGAEAVCGLTVIECLNSNIINCSVSGIADSNNVSAWTGYGVYVVGGENFFVENLKGDLCRHTIDFGTQGSFSRSIPRYGLVIGGCASYNYSCGYSTHDSEYISFVDNTALYCGGGFIGRGTYTRFIRPVIIGTHSDKPSFYSTSQSYLHGICIGEVDSPFISAAAGRGGEGLLIKDPVIDFTGSTPGAHGIQSYDPLIDANIDSRLNSLVVLRSGLYVEGDVITNTKIDLLVDGKYQYNPGSGNSNGFCFKPANSSAVQGITDSEINIVCKNIRGAACYIGGGKNGGSTDRNIIKIKVQSLNVAGGATSATPQLIFDNNNYGRNELKLDLPFTTSATAISAKPVNTYWMPNNFYLEGVYKSI